MHVDLTDFWGVLAAGALLGFGWTLGRNLARDFPHLLRNVASLLAGALLLLLALLLAVWRRLTRRPLSATPREWDTEEIEVTGPQPVPMFRGREE